MRNSMFIFLLVIGLLSGCYTECNEDTALYQTVGYSFDYLRKHENHYHFNNSNNCVSSQEVVVEVLGAQKKYLNLSCGHDFTFLPIDLNKNNTTYLFKTESGTEKLTVNYRLFFQENKACGLSSYLYHEKSADVSTLISPSDLYQIEIRDENEEKITDFEDYTFNITDYYIVLE